MALNTMKLRINPRYRVLEPFVRHLAEPGYFAAHGQTLHDGRNTLKLFEVEGLRVVVKRYGHLSLLNRLVYGTLRRSKAERAYRHAARLRERGIDSPEEVAFLEIRRHGVLAESYFVSLHSEYESLLPVMELERPMAQRQSILDALAAFLLRLHDAGIVHLDLNIGNILYRREGETGYAFQLIDTNRMLFRRRLSTRRRLDNLRRLSCPAPVYLYLLDRYARLIRTDTDTIQFKGVLMRLLFENRQQLKRRIKRHIRRENAQTGTRGAAPDREAGRSNLSGGKPPVQ